MGRLEGKVALISGGARGQGAAEAKLFCREGARVVFGDILDDQGREVETEIRNMGWQATYVHLDVTSESDWRDAVNRTVNEYGRLDVLVNNAGITLNRKIEATTEEDWDRVMDINAKGVFFGTKHAIPAMRAAGGGSIVNISSIAGLVAADPTYGLAAYGPSKAAVRLFSKETSVQHAGDNIRCNSVHPGPIETPMLLEALSDPKVLEQRLGRVPLGRMGTVEDIAYGVLFLASNESSYVTGAELVIDGGATAQ